MKINDLTGEIEEQDNANENNALAVRELTQMAIFVDWLEKKEELLTAKQQFEMVDKPFRKVIKELFDKYSLTSLDNDYMTISFRNGYVKKSFDETKLKEFILQNGGNPDDFKVEKWVDSTISIKYKE